MFASSLRFVPWRNKQEWEDVYRNAFSGSPELMRNACDVMEMWLLLRNDLPPAIECTLNLLQVELKDVECKNDGQVSLMYSSTILRVVNMVCDSGRKSNRETLYELAEHFSVPDWIVNLRHEIAHGVNVPDISLLRIAGKFLFNWLKTYYWDVENEDCQDIVIERSRQDVCKENIFYLIKTYIQLAEQHKKGVNLFESIPDDNFKRNFLQGLYDHCILTMYKQCLPWLTPPNFLSEPPGSDPKEISGALHLVLAQIRPYLDTTITYGFDSYSVLVEHFLEEYSKSGDIDISLWDELVQQINKWKLLDSFMVALCRSLPHSGRDSLIDLLCKSVIARRKVEVLKECVTSTNLFSDSIEIRIVKQLFIKKRLNLSEVTNVSAMNEMFRRIEKRVPELKNTWRLMDPVDYFSEDCLGPDMIKGFISCPNLQTKSVLERLYEILEPRYSKVVEKKINTLIDIFTNSNENKKRHSSRIFSLEDVKRQRGFMPVDASGGSGSKIDLRVHDGPLMDTSEQENVFRNSDVPKVSRISRCHIPTTICLGRVEDNGIMSAVTNEDILKNYFLFPLS